MNNVAPDEAFFVGILGLALGIVILVWVRPLFSVHMYDERLRQAGTKSELVFLWFRLIGRAQRLAFILAGVLLIGVGLFGVGEYLVGFFGLSPLRLIP